MKKLMIALAVVAMGFAASAANVIWNTANLYIPNADGTWSSTQATGNNMAGATMSVLVTFYSDNEGKKGDVFAAGGTLSGSAGATQSAIGGTASGFEFSTKYWVDAIVTYTKGGQVQTMNTLEGYFTTQGQGNTTVAFQATAKLNQKIIQNGVTNFTAVPEPTSSLLLLLGVAGLALRRRRA